MKKSAITILASCLIAISVHGADDFLKDLENMTKLATKTKINADYVPGAINIVSADKMRTLGAQNLYEALGFIPGFNLSVDNIGVKTISSRGFEGKGRMKLLIDGIEIESMYRGENYYFLSTPIELIDRIEITRGPGSSLYGSNASLNVINVITLKDSLSLENRITGGVGSFNRKLGSFSSRSVFPNGIRLFLSGSIESDNKGVEITSDTATNSSVYTSFAPEKTDERSKSHSLNASLFSNDFEVDVQHQQNFSGSGFGAGFKLAKDKNLKNLDNEYMHLSLKKSFTVSGVDFESKASIQKYNQKIDTELFTRTSLNDQLKLKTSISELILAAEFIGTKNIDEHRLIAGYKFSKSKLTHSEIEAKYENTGIIVIPYQSGFSQNPTRETHSVYFDDSYHLTNKTIIEAGLRFDSFSNFETTVSPRTSLVHSTDEIGIFKLTFGKSYRAPSFIEMYVRAPQISIGDESLIPERSETLQLDHTCYFNKTKSDFIKTSLFQISMKNIIQRDATTKIYQQSNEKITSLGAEIEFNYEHTENITTFGSISHQKIDENSAFIESPDFFGNLGSIQKITDEFSLSEVFFYTNKIKRNEVRGNLPSTNIFNINLQYSPLKNFQITSGIKNLFNQKYSFASPVNTLDSDYEREGRTLFLKANFTF